MGFVKPQRGHRTIVHGVDRFDAVGCKEKSGSYRDTPSGTKEKNNKGCNLVML